MHFVMEGKYIFIYVYICMTDIYIYMYIYESVALKLVLNCLSRTIH